MALFDGLALGGRCGRRRRPAHLQLVLHSAFDARLHAADRDFGRHVPPRICRKRTLSRPRAVQCGIACDRSLDRHGLVRFADFRANVSLHFTALGGALTLTFLNLPAMMRVTQEALASVPDTYREASMGMGATKWQTVIRAILPSAIGPLTTGVVLVSGRIFGETAALIFTAGASVSYGKSAYDFNPFHTAETLAVGLYQTHREALVPDADAIGNGSALVLLVMVLVFNIVARIVGRQLTMRFTGKA
ncbi:MAG: ABC transporter permease subunit [Candidatus Eremiobacteraeota bacterium]|nr:ABC transporter permease subunit [Candidatus Eremiobacteraeota bacterium]